MAQLRDYHVIPNFRIGGWDVKREHASRASRHFETQQKAINAARKMSKRNNAELFIHGHDGKLLRKDTRN
ncbi:DUF2188 domain-containing protein [Legionella jamestowniensis]|uniref:DUF2188 domain-containing protein n=1 Tax=Legionella jamestowniensis TaxID=455 RepID=A0ABX2XY25_9GAMM|nr:DUF2188 domain-containing protein [Legionella jamestowniensis]OCH99555.1 hypothetical protein A8135_07290 [Legionella jamestowniensis]